MEEYVIEKEERENYAVPINQGCYYKKVHSKHIESYGDFGANNIRDNIMSTFKVALEQYYSEKNNNMLLVGKVQSGKTSNLELFTALALDNGYNMVIIYGPPGRGRRHLPDGIRQKPPSGLGHRICHRDAYRHPLHYLRPGGHAFLLSVPGASILSAGRRAHLGHYDAAHHRAHHPGEPENRAPVLSGVRGFLCLPTHLP